MPPPLEFQKFSGPKGGGLILIRVMTFRGQGKPNLGKAEGLSFIPEEGVGQNSDQTGQNSAQMGIASASIAPELFFWYLR